MPSTTRAGCMIWVFCWGLVGGGSWLGIGRGSEQCKVVEGDPEGIMEALTIADNVVGMLKISHAADVSRETY